LYGYLIVTRPSKRIFIENIKKKMFVDQDRENHEHELKTQFSVSREKPPQKLTQGQSSEGEKKKV